MRIESWARDGLTDAQIAANMGIGVSTLYKYQNEHVEIVDALKRGKAPVDMQVENALLKRALGYEYTEKHIKREILGYKMENGKRVPILGSKSYEEVTTKQVAPDVLAQIYWLKNRKPTRWRDKPDESSANYEPVRVIVDV